MPRLATPLCAVHKLSSSLRPPMPCTRTRSPPPRQAWLAQPYTSSWKLGNHTATRWENHNIMKLHSTVQGTQQPCITHYYTGNGHYCGSKSTCNFYLSFCFCISAILAPLIPEDIREAHPVLQSITYKTQPSYPSASLIPSVSSPQTYQGKIMGFKLLIPIQSKLYWIYLKLILPNAA